MLEKNMDILVKETRPQEAAELCRIQKAAFLPLYERYHDDGNPYLRGEEDITDRLNTDRFRYFTIFLDGEIAGGVLYRCKGETPFTDDLEKGQYYLQRIYISPEHQGKRIAQTAILLCEKDLPGAKCFLVDFPQDLTQNKRCYVKAGFTDTGKRLEVQPGLVLACYEKTLNE